MNLPALLVACLIFGFFGVVANEPPRAPDIVLGVELGVFSAILFAAFIYAGD